MNELALINEAQKGDLDAFNTLILHYQDSVFNTALRILGDDDLAADATQDAFISAFKSINSFRGGSFKAWLMRTVTNACYDELRRQKRRPTTPLEPDTDDGEEMDSPRWLADPNDGKAADLIEATPLEVGITRTRCVATMLKGGHAENALPQLAEATVNCRIMPGIEPPTVQAELQQLVGPHVEITPYPDLGKPTQPSPLRPDIVKAFTDAVHARFPSQPIIPQMSTGATDGLEFRARGMPVYGTDGSWMAVPDDERAHGKDERLPVQALWDNVLHWERMVRELASKG